MSFWLIAMGLALLALLFVVVPLLRPVVQNPNSGTDAEAARAVLRQRREELEVDQQAGRLSADQYDQALEELQREILAELSTPENINSHGSGISTGLLVVSLLVPVAGFVLYSRLGAWEQWQAHATGAPRAGLAEQTQGHVPAPVSAKANGNQEAGGDAEAEAMQQTIARLQSFLLENPDDHDRWQLLGRSFMAMGQPNDAVPAFAKAAALLGDQRPELLVQYGEALAAANGNDLTGKPAELFRKAVALDPEQPKTIFYAGMAAFAEQSYAEAIGYWQKLLQRQPPEQVRSVLLKNIKLAAEKGGLPMPDVAQNMTRNITQNGSAASGRTKQDSAQPDAGVRIPVSVQLSAAARAQAKQVAQTPVGANQLVYVYAKAANGPPMPLAVQRYRLAQLPKQIVLTERDAMMQGVSLANFEQYIVGARIARDGTANKQSGDWFAEAPAGRDSVVQLLIDQQVP